MGFCLGTIVKVSKLINCLTEDARFFPSMTYTFRRKIIKTFIFKGKKKKQWIEDKIKSL